MFYEKQQNNQCNDYKMMLALIGSLSNLFADKKYKIDFCVLGTYEKMYHLYDEESESDAN